MKKTILHLSLLTASLGVLAQPVPTDYRGAFAPAPAAPWTEGWANFTPQSTNYPSTTVNIPLGNITTNTTWTSNNVYNLTGYVYIDNGATLTIEPGTVIRSTAKSALVVKRGSFINAQGTVQAPIIFTSNNAIGARRAGDWGGVVIAGAARHNLTAGPTAKVEGDIEAQHGGDNDADSSGIFSYVRIEYAGQPLISGTSSEINGLSLYSVGSKTKIDHVQVSFGGDDSFEWFGGTVNCSHLVSFRTVDDDFDTDNGFRGTVQFAVAHRDAAIADVSGSNGFESDNDNQGSYNEPKTAPKFYNVTLVGPKEQATTPVDQHARALHIRRNSACSLFNSIVIGFRTGGLYLDGRRTISNAVNGLLKFENNYVANSAPDVAIPATNSDTLGIASSADLLAWVQTPAFNNVIGTDVKGGLTNPFVLNANVDYRPVAGTTGIEDEKLLSAQQVVVFPNPAVNQVEIALTKSLGNATVTIQNALGATVATSQAVEGSTKFDVSNLTNGLYIVSASNGGQVISKALLINR